MKTMGPFDPPVGRQTSVILLKNYITESHALVTSMSTRTTTEVLNIDQVTGALTFDTEACFNNEGEALRHLEEFGYNILLRGSSLLGYAVVGSTAGVLLATKLRDKATLPGGHVVQLVQESQWTMITLDQERDPASIASEQDYWKSVLQHPIAGSHFFCETADLTSPFPSSRRVIDPIPEFVWNTWLSQPLRQLGLFYHCPALLQGAIESADETHPTGHRYSIALMSRRSRRHPGTRYLARGLNELAGPGNEIEVDLMMWTPRAGTVMDPSKVKDRGLVRWARVSWRRGTVPIWWGVDISRGLQAEVYVKEEQPYNGTLTYFKNVQKQYEGQEEGPEVPITCINLLHCNPKKAAELTLQMHFQEGMQHVKKLSPTSPYRLLNFDWHGNLGQLTEEKGIEAFWNFMEPHVKATGFAMGEMQRTPPHNTDGNPSNTGAAAATSSSSVSQHPPVAVTPWGNDWRMVWSRKQHGVLRYNCADSLDRTNAATCFAMLPVMQEALRELGVQLDITSNASFRALSPLGSALKGGSSSQLPPTSPPSDQDLSRHDLTQAQAQAQHPANASGDGLPPGWEKRKYGDRYVYIDHVNKRTQWDPPSPLPAPAPEEGEHRHCSEAGGGHGRNGSLSHISSAPELSSIAARGGEGASIEAEHGPWEFFSYSLQDVRDRLYRETIADYVDMFQRHGDVLASLYTGSAAMHSHVLGLVLPTTSRSYGSGGVGKLQNLRVAVQRRWNNAVSDASRQQAIELFLGINLEVHCPGVNPLYPPAADVGGLHVQDVSIAGEKAHQAAGIRDLGLRVHDGRVGVTGGLESLDDDDEGEDEDDEDPVQEAVQGSEDLSSTIPVTSTIGHLPVDLLGVDVAAGVPSQYIENGDKSSDEEASDAFDPLGAVKTPAKIQHHHQPQYNDESVDLLGLSGEGMAPPPMPRTSRPDKPTLEATLKDLLL